MIDLNYYDEIAIIKMNRLPVNAIDTDFLDQLGETLKIGIQSKSKAIVLTGQGSIFSAGVDLVRLLKGGTDYIRTFLANLEQMLETLFFCPKPVVAAINGHAIAGGCVIASCADKRLMAEGKARIGVPELRVGVPFPVIIMELMRAKVNSAYFEEIMLAGATYRPEEALQRGLIDEIVNSENLMDKAVATAKSLASIRPELYSFTKQQTRQFVREAIDQNSKLYGNQIKAIWESEQTQQAIKSYVQQTLKK